MKKTQPTTPPRRPGRPRLDVDANEQAVRVNLSMTAAQRDKLIALGGSEWIRKQLEKAEG